MIRTVVGIDGMMCGMCEAHVNDAVRRTFEVQSVKSSRRKKTCVIVSEGELDQTRLAEAIGELGYDVTGIHAEPYERRGLFGFFS